MRKILLAIVGIGVLTGVYGQSTHEQAEKFETLLRIVNYAYVDSVKSDALVEDAIKGMLKKLDPHSSYISKKDLKEMNEPLVGNFEGIGIQFNILHDTILVVSPISGGPSERLGIRAGDKIVEIEGENVAGIGIQNKDVTKKLRGKKGTEVLVGIQRKGVRKLVDYTIIRDKIPIYSVDASYMARPDIGYIKLNRFSATSMDEIHSALDTLRQQGMKDLILDLRGNSGGYLQTAIKLADEFLPSRKLIVYTEGRSFPKDEKFATSKGEFEEGKLVVLIDEGSASASEIVSGAVQDWDRGLIIGRRSFGKGLVQKPYMLPDGSAVRLTISRYYTPTGRSIQRPYEKGVENYYKDISSRLNNGELFSADSINFPDSLKFVTPRKRVVYGGGGIMPDIFVPLDTTMNSDYYTKVARKGLLYEFALTYVDRNRAKLISQFQSVEDFKKNFKPDAEFMKKFTDFAEKEGVEKDNNDLAISSDHLGTNLKARLASNLWNSTAYYMVFNELNPTYKKALDVLQDDTFKRMQLAIN